MKYVDMRPAMAAYSAGENVTKLLRKTLETSQNTSEIIEIAYDLQAGSYTRLALDDAKQWNAGAAEFASILQEHVASGDRVLEAGTGEMTKLTGVANRLPTEITHFAMDISWSRLRYGERFVSEHMRPEIVSYLSVFVADMLHLPLADASIDVIWTSHALEPNGGRERPMLQEIFRVARRRAVLFEPSYEHASPEGKARMDKHGYIKELPEAIAALGWRLDAVQFIQSTRNPLNPTYAYIASPLTERERPDGEPWACPATRLLLKRKPSCYWSPGSRLAYPIIEGLPILRPEAAVLTTHLE